MGIAASVRWPFDGKQVDTLDQTTRQIDTFKGEQHAFNESICKTVRDNHSDLSNRQTVLGDRFDGLQNEQAKLVSEMTIVSSKVNSFKDLVKSSDRENQKLFEMGLTRFNEAQSNHNRDMASLRTDHSALSSKLDLVSDQNMELERLIVSRDRDNKTAIDGVFDHLKSLEKHRAGDLQRFSRIEDSQEAMLSDIVTTARATSDLKNLVELNARESKRTTDGLEDRFSDVTKRLTKDGKRLQHLEDDHEKVSSDVFETKNETAIIKNRFERKLEADQQILTEFDARFENLQSNQKLVRSEIEEIKNINNKLKEYCVIAIVIGVLVYFKFYNS